jgi:fused signal recognition particle receptor
VALFDRLGSATKRLFSGLAKTRRAFARLLAAANTEELEAALLAADVGVKATGILVNKLGPAGENRQQGLEAEIAALLRPGTERRDSSAKAKPEVVMIVGVNGSGKTTTVGKLCHYFAGQGRSVVVAAADTFRDAASEQLRVWAERAGVEIVSSAQGQDAGAVAFDTIQKARVGGLDVVIVDTAGRLHTRKDLMDEAVKIKRVCGKVRPGAPDEVWLVLDATVGQNGLRQAVAFNELLGLTGLIVTKLDGTAKGGVLIPIVLELGVPVRFIGTGETLDDLAAFDADAYARALFREEA